jgi:hypothetical protein
MIAGDSTLPPKPERRRLQFSLGGLMVFVFGVAVGLSMACMQTLDWTFEMRSSSFVSWPWCSVCCRSGNGSDEAWGRFCSVWLAMFITAAIGIPTVALFSFAMWFSPWYSVSWF